MAARIRPSRPVTTTASGPLSTIWSSLAWIGVRADAGASASAGASADEEEGGALLAEEGDGDDAFPVTLGKVPAHGLGPARHPDPGQGREQGLGTLRLEAFREGLRALAAPPRSWAAAGFASTTLRLAASTISTASEVIWKRRR